MTMNLKNEALQKLYDTLVNSTISMSPYAESPIDKAFAECDDQLSESVTFEHIKDLQNRNDILRKSEAALLKANVELASKKRQFEKDLDDAKKQLKYFTLSRDDWRARAKHAEKEVEELKETLEKTNTDRTELQNDRDTYNSLYAESKKDYVKLFEENKKLKARTDCLRYEVEWYRKHYKEQQSDKIKELQNRLNSIPVNATAFRQGQTDLWVKLQNVNNSQPFELATCFPDVTGMEDILSWDLEDFLDAYKKWQEEKETERMRDYLERFCMGRFCCDRCPLHTGKFSCGRGKWFGDMTDEELKRHYDKARDYNKRPWHGDATAETPINDLSSWSCTMTGTVEINKDLLEKVCGVKLDDK